jgi:hypothetical protein
MQWKTSVIQRSYGKWLVEKCIIYLQGWFPLFFQITIEYLWGMSKLKTLGTADLDRFGQLSVWTIQIFPNFDPAHILPTMIVDSLSCQDLIILLRAYSHIFPLRIWLGDSLGYPPLHFYIDWGTVDQWTSSFWWTAEVKKLIQLLGCWG